MPCKVSDVNSRDELMYIMEIILHILFISAESISYWLGSFFWWPRQHMFSNPYASQQICYFLSL